MVVEVSLEAHTKLRSSPCHRPAADPALLAGEHQPAGHSPEPLLVSLVREDGARDGVPKLRKQDLYLATCDTAVDGICCGLGCLQYGQHKQKWLQWSVGRYPCNLLAAPCSVLTADETAPTAAEITT